MIDDRWTEKHEIAVGLLKKALTSWPVLVGPRFDGTPFYLSTDASSSGIGCHLWQKDENGCKRSIAYLSRQTTEVESRAHSSTLELIAVKFGLDKCSRYTYGFPVVVQTDCQAVRDLLRSETTAGPRAAWKEAICAAGIVEFEHVPGVSNTIADALSRNPSGEPEETKATTTAEEEMGGSPLTIQVNSLTTDEDIALLDRFADDDLEDVLRWILQRDIDMVDKELLGDVKRRAARYWIEDGSVVKYRVPGHGAVTVLPKTEGFDFAMKNHVESGHLGRDLVQARILATHIWAGSRKDIDRALHECKRCVQFGTRMQRLLLKPVFEFAPFARVAMDYLAMPVGKNGVDNILVAVDVFSRFMVAYPFKGNGTAEKTIKSLEDLSRTYRRPKALLLDNDRAFDNAAVREWCGADTTLDFAAPYEHVGLAENGNHLLLERLRRLANLDVEHVPTVLRPPYPRNWPEVLQGSVKALNDRKLTYLGGLSPREVLLGPEQGGGEEIPTVPQRLALLEAGRADARDAFRDEQERRKGNSKEWNSYYPSVGHLVLLYDTSDDRTYSTEAKLRPKWQGPWRVRKIAGNRSVTLETLEGLPRKGTVGFRRLKRWIGEEDGDGDGKEGDDGGEVDDERDDDRDDNDLDTADFNNDNTNT
ncbi:hypothetical protein FFLO_07120 [Filobasidium floriforme]|uniref:Integrase catalytic domain-containing protein n=1 Tax=Filobasidium floriforme TaxID=5210 RepID=A0A8K0JJ88_9TREE|nr:hypothetical protein FFLO_07120 [Filobasidium floriforme]